MTERQSLFAFVPMAAKHMSQKQRNEFNELFMKMEKELRESKYKRPVSQQVWIASRRAQTVFAVCC